MNTTAQSQTQPTTLPVDAHLFDEAFQLTNVDEYGIIMQELLSGAISPPPEGARFDIFYEGRIEGARLNGYLKGVDYARVRADGRFQLDIRARIMTDDGVPIALYADGILKAPDLDGVAEVRLNMEMTTSHPEYTWVNSLQVWGSGTVNLETGQIRVSTYVA